MVKKFRGQQKFITPERCNQLLKKRMTLTTAVSICFNISLKVIKLIRTGILD
jgi:hypothetical protein